MRNPFRWRSRVERMDRQLTAFRRLTYGHLYRHELMIRDLEQRLGLKATYAIDPSGQVTRAARRGH